MTEQIAALDALIEAVEAGRVGMGLNTSGVFGDNQTALDAVEAFHGSLDAAMALHEALLPNHSWDNWRGVRHDGVKYYGCNIPGINTVYAAAPARAWLICILKAYRAGL